MGEATPTSYWDYLALEELLSLQEGLGDGDVSGDELHFIVVHQAYELWFKVVLVELRAARDRIGGESVPENDVPHVVHHLRRIHAIFRLGYEQFGIMETLTPQDFLSFRDKLVPASGFQSFQIIMASRPLLASLISNPIGNNKSESTFRLVETSSTIRIR